MKKATAKKTGSNEVVFSPSDDSSGKVDEDGLYKTPGAGRVISEEEVRTRALEIAQGFHWLDDDQKQDVARRIVVCFSPKSKSSIMSSQSLKNYVRSIASHVKIVSLRKAKKDKETQQEIRAVDFKPITRTPYEQCAIKDDLAQLREHLNLLPIDQRLAVLLIVAEELSYGEAARLMADEICGCDVKRVSNLVWTARRNLREMTNGAE